MAGPEEDITVEDSDDDAPASIKARITGAGIAVIVLIVLVFGYLHVSLPGVPGGAAAPKGHYPGPCWACHMVSG